MMTNRRELCSVNEASKPAWLVWMPHVLVACWLLYLGILIWQHVLHSVQPPLYDPISYIQKAMNFWRMIEQGHFFNPLNLEPTVRPPGSIIMSYPFGFSSNFHGFLFRSVFLPILSIVLAVYIVAGKKTVREAGWRVAAMASLFSTLPMFYWFDWNSERVIGSGWGLVDNFQAGIAALAMASVVKSLMKRSWRWLLAGASLASFTLLIKPSGLMIMALIGSIWVMFVALEWFRASKHKPHDHSLRAYVFKGGSSILIIYICITALCVFSGYLSKSNFAYAQQALKVMREVLQLPFQQILLLFHHSVGEALPLWVISVGVLFMYRFLTVREGNEPLTVGVLGLLVSSLFVWSIGVGYWLIIQAGGDQVRYFYPFLLMGVICTIPAALFVWPNANRLMHSLLMAICFLPMLNMAVMMSAGDNPPLSWQKWTGINVSVGGDKEEVGQAYALLRDLRKAKTNAEIYSFKNWGPVGVFQNVGTYEALVRPDLPVFNVLVSIDWVRGFVVRVEELICSNYILIEKSDLDSSVVNATRKFPLYSSYSEGTAFEAWLSTINEQSGVETVSEGRRLRLLRIVDRAALNRAIDQFISAHEWRPEFKAANRPIWWNVDTVKATYGKPSAENIGFGGVYKLHALTIKSTEQGIKIDVWWEELRHEEANNRRYLFFHLVDESGKIIYNQQIALFPYRPLDAEKRWRHGAVQFNEALSDGNLMSLAFGIYQPSGQFLMSDKIMPSDWEGRRVLIPLR